MPYFDRRNYKAVDGGATTNVSGNGAGYTAPNGTLAASSPMVEDIVSDLLESGAFRLVVPNAVADSTSIHGWWILEAQNCDPLYSPSPSAPSGFDENQNWRIAINSDDISIVWGSERQIDPSLTNRADVVESQTPGVEMISDLNLMGRSATPNIARPKSSFNYILTTTDRGFALIVYPQGYEDDPWYHRILCIQRPTNPKTGNIKIDGGAPVFAIYSGTVSTNINRKNTWVDIDERLYVALTQTTPDNNLGVGGLPMTKPGNDDAQPGFYYSVVRDTFNPSSSRAFPLLYTSSNVFYSFSWLWMQPSHYDNLNIILKFATGLAVPGRYLYFDEIDIIGLAHAASITLGQEATINLYGGEIRSYQGTVGYRSVMTLSPNGSQGPGQAVDVFYNSRIACVKTGSLIL